MPLSQNTLTAVVVLFLVALFASRMVKGKSRQTAEGLVFPTKLAFTVLRFVALPAYYGVFFYFNWQRSGRISAPFTAIFVVLMLFLVSQLPGTIVLTTNGIEQRFWFLRKKTIQYPEVMAIQRTQAGRALTVLGDNRVRITHTPNHSDQAGFLKALEERTGKRAA